MKKLTAILCVLFALVMVLAIPASASAPYQTYTYSIAGKALYSPDAYIPAKTVDSTYMGLLDAEIMSELYPELTINEVKEKLVALDSPTDLETDDLGNVYIADKANNRIVVLDRYYKLKFILDEFVNEQGIVDNLSQPQGVYITADKIVEGELVEGKIYVCDTGNKRIVTYDRSGNFIAIIPEPESEMFESGSIYRPIAVAVDKYDRLYVVSSTTYQGIIVMTDEGEFTQFIGAQKVVISAWDIIWRRFQTDEQREKSSEYLSTEFNNITVNERGHVYVTTSSIDEGQLESAIIGKSKSGDYAPVKLLNASGAEIMSRNGFYPPSGEIDIQSTGKKSETVYGVSTVTDVAVGPNNTWSIIDTKRSKVFTYDIQGNLLFAFGDTGRQLGNISNNGLTAVTYQGDNMLLLDTVSKSFTVYQLTEYGEILHQALWNTNERLYDKAVDDWIEILKRNSNFDAAYVGIGNALYRDGKYSEAIEYYKSAYDTENYSKAYQELRKNWISGSTLYVPNLLLIVIFIIVIIILVMKFMKFAAKVNKRVSTSGEKITYGKELLYAFHVIFHPFDGFWDLKHEKRGSIRAASTILAASVVAFYYNAIGKGYIMNPQGNYSTIILTIVGVLVPFFLFITANWCLTTLFEGEGSFKDIFMVAGYSMTPFVFIVIPVTIVSNFVVEKETAILTLLITLAFIWMALLLILGVQVVHDYSIGKNFLTVIGTLLGVICIMFIVLLFSALLGKLVSFIANIVVELQYRI